MKKIAVFGLLVGLSFWAGCVRTLAPVVEDKDRIADASLAGEWANQEDPKQIIRVAPPGADKSYEIEVVDENGRSGKFTGWLGRVGELLLAEITPEVLPEGWSDEYKGHFAPLFSFYIIYATKPALRIGAIETDWFGSYIKAHPGEVALSPRDSDLVISPPETVRAFLIKHHKDQGAVTEAVFVRREVKK